MLLFWLILAHSAPVVQLSVAHIAQDLHIFHQLTTESKIGDVMHIKLVAVVLSTATLLACSTGSLERLSPNVLPPLRSHVLATVVAPCFIDLVAGRSDGLEQLVGVGPWFRHDGLYDGVCVHLISSLTG